MNSPGLTHGYCGVGMAETGVVSLMSTEYGLPRCHDGHGPDELGEVCDF